MTLPSFANAEDLPPSCAADPVEADHVLWVVSTAVRAAAGGKSFVDDDGKLSVTGLAADLLRSVTIEATVRRLRNPDGATSRTETTGPWTESVTVEAGNVYFTRAERDMIAQAADLAYPNASAFPGLGTIGTTRGRLETARYCEDSEWEDEWAGPPVGYPL